MAHSYSFAIVRLGTNDARDERLNVGLVVFHDEKLDVRVGRRVEKVRALSAGVEVATLRDLISNLAHVDEALQHERPLEIAERHAQIRALGPLSLSSLGTFIAENGTDYEARVSSILGAMVDVEPAPRVAREKRSKLLTQVKRIFREERRRTRIYPRIALSQRMSLTMAWSQTSFFETGQCTLSKQLTPPAKMRRRAARSPKLQFPLWCLSVPACGSGRKIPKGNWFIAPPPISRESQNPHWKRWKTRVPNW